MAKVNSKSLVITVSQLLKDTDADSVLLSPQSIEQIEAVVAQLVAEDAGNNPVVVEVQVAE